MSEAPPFPVERLLEEAREGLVRVGPADLPALVEDRALVVDTRPVEQREPRRRRCPARSSWTATCSSRRLDPTRPDGCPGRVPDRRIVLVCNEGYSSSLAARTLQRLGLRSATDLVGG